MQAFSTPVKASPRHLSSGGGVIANRIGSESVPFRTGKVKAFGWRTSRAAQRQICEDLRSGKNEFLHVILFVFRQVVWRFGKLDRGGRLVGPARVLSKALRLRNGRREPRVGCCRSCEEHRVYAVVAAPMGQRIGSVGSSCQRRRDG